MSDKELINKITNELGSHKAEFLSKVQARIYTYISSKSTADCLTIVEKVGNKRLVWVPSEALNGYIPRLACFMGKKSYDGNELDSYLTDDIVDIVINTYNEYIKGKSNAIVKPISEKIFSQQHVVDSIAEQAIDVWKGSISTALRQKLMRILVHKIESSISDNIVHASSSAVVATTSKVIATATAIPISKSIAMVLAKNMVVLMKGVIAKLLASSAFKATMAALVKKFVAVKVAAILFSFIGTKMAGISIGWVVAPIIAGILIYEYNTLPDNMAGKISEKVSEELSGNFSNMNKSVASGIVTGLGASALGSFISDVANDISMKEIVDSLSYSK